MLLLCAQSALSQNALLHPRSDVLLLSFPVSEQDPPFFIKSATFNRKHSRLVKHENSPLWIYCALAHVVSMSLIGSKSPLFDCSVIQRSGVVLNLR